MKKYILGLFVVGFVLAPWFSSFAQGGDIDPNPQASNCVSIINNLRYRDRDINKNGEVSTLQDFLQSKGYLNSEPTGYFGLLTFSAVKSFQSANGIYPVSGYVGPITRGKIENLTCSDIYPNPNNPVISGITGPQSLNVNQTGTWTINASGSNGGNLSYSVNWGDNMVYGNGVSIYPQPLPTQQSATFTHSYSQAGTFNPTFTVTNNVECFMAPCNSGGSASTSLSVNVVGIIANPSITVLSPNGGEIIQRGQSYTIKWNTTGFSSSDRVNISLKDDSIYCPLGMVGCWTAFGIGSTQNTGSYTWNTNLKMSGDGGPNSQPIYVGSNFRIILQIESTNNSTLSALDYSNNPFTIQ